MKKLLISFILLATISCGKGNIIDPVGTDRCSKTADEYTTALTAWSSDINNKAKCEAVKKSLTAIIKDCSVYTVAQRKIYEDQLKDFTCD